MSTHQTVSGFIDFYDRTQMARFLRELDVNSAVIDYTSDERLQFVATHMTQTQFSKIFDYAISCHQKTPWGELWKNRT